MKIVVAFLAAAVLGTLFWIGWRFRPWMSPGRGVLVSSQSVGNYEFQVWQRKNTGFTEPFATGLFVRKQGERWQGFLLDFEDLYRPTLVLRKEADGVAVFRDSRKLGVFEEVSQTFKRQSDGMSLTGIVIHGEPPDNWWLEPQTEAGNPHYR